jgi:epoxyqueuosine reductase QueG
MGSTLKAMRKEYNKIAEEMGFKKLGHVHKDTTVTLPCKVNGFLDETYAKYPDFDAQVIMEYKPMNNYLLRYLPH